MEVGVIFLGAYWIASAEILLGMVWTSFRIIGGFLAHEMID